MKYFRFVFAITILFAVLSAKAQTIVKANDPNLSYMGRVMVNDSAAMLQWSASSVVVNFEGTGIGFNLRDEVHDNYFNLIIDGKLKEVLHDTVGTIVKHLITGLGKGKHRLEIFKRTEWAMGKAWLYNFEFEKGGRLLKAGPVKTRKMEFFGNSITCGYAVEDTSGKDRGTSPYENAYVSYATLTARHFNADFHNTSKSGIGITVSWFPLIMPEMYDRLDATDAKSKWDFSKYTPDLIVINLFQNDSWIVKLKDNEQFKARFGNSAPTEDFIVNAYRDFVKSVRSKYPEAQIICILGSMDATKEGSPWPGYIQKAVDALSDSKIFTHFIPYKNTNGHPNVKEQQGMADDLIGFIEKNIKW